MERNITKKAAIDGSICTLWWPERRRTASQTIQTQVRRSRPVSMKAEKFSTLPWPYWCSASAGLSETRTESSVTKAATRSRPECAASDRMPRLSVEMPTISLRTVIPSAASSELSATLRFSFCILSSTGLSLAEDTLILSQVFGSEYYNHCCWLHLLENHYARILP